MDNIAIGDFDLLYSVFLTINLFNIGIQKSQKELTKTFTFMLISNLKKKSIVLYGLCKHISAL